MTLHLPDPCLLVLIGPAGSGKSTLAERLLRPTEIVSSDACRAVSDDDPRRVTPTRRRADAFALVHRIVATRLRRGLTAAVDATSVAWSGIAAAATAPSAPTSCARSAASWSAASPDSTPRASLRS